MGWAVGDMGDVWRDVKEHRRNLRATLGVNCPRCAEVRPKAHPSILLPGQRCKVDGYVDSRPRLAQPARAALDGLHQMDHEDSKT
jgi:hypothetical protein